MMNFYFEMNRIIVSAPDYPRCHPSHYPHVRMSVTF